MPNTPNLPLDEKKPKSKLWLIIGGSVLIAALLAGAAVYFWQYTQIKQLEKNYQQQILNLQNQNDQLEASSTSDQTTYIVPSGDGSALPIGLDKIYVDWAAEPTEVTQTIENCTDPQADFGIGASQCFLVGQLAKNNQRFAGAPFYLETSPTMGGSEMRHFIIIKASNGPYIKLYAESAEPKAEPSTIIGITDIPEEIPFPGTNYLLKKGYPDSLFADIELDKKIFTNDQLGDFYLTKNGCVVVELPDHTVIDYNLVIPFISYENRVPDITFSNGNKNQNEYDFTTPTCGGLCTYLTTIDLKTESELEVIGKAAGGDSVYRLKDQNDSRLQELYKNENTMAYYNADMQSQKVSKYSYDEFIKLNPYIFWKSPLGEWIKFTNSKFAVLAEMCKPVIYLYPQTTTDLNLKLKLHGFLTKTEPLYQDGWQVSAEPNGKIKNLATGDSYDYLLWEGLGLDYPSSDKGWVVEQKNLDSFFSDKLSKLGLNDQEMGDFKEYWLARLTEKPFYKISFLSQRQFESLASVEFSPIEPTVFIRVMMTADGLDDFVSIPEQLLPATPQRSGFTAVEWGGTLLK